LGDGRSIDAAVPGDGHANFTLNTNNSVRWGVAFNNEADWITNDVIGGIGLGTFYGKNYSAGDFHGGGINRQARVEMYVR
jgi:hypothetical protein